MIDLFDDPDFKDFLREYFMNEVESERNKAMSEEKEITKRDVVEAWLSELCTKLDYMVLDDHEFWSQDFKDQVQAAQDLDLIDNLGLGFYYYFPEDEDVELLYPMIAASA